MAFMNQLSYKHAFKDASHSPNLRTLKSVLKTTNPITDFCIPVNIGFPPAPFMAELQSDFADRVKYYPSEPGALREKFAAFLNVPHGNLIAGNGSTELFYNLLHSSCRKHRILTCIPTFGRWTDAPRASGHHVVGYARLVKNQFGIDHAALCDLAHRQQVDMVILSNPSNPTGHLTDRKEMLELIASLRSQVPSLELVIVDESFLDFSSRRKTASLIADVQHMDDVIVLKSLGKSFGLHGTRMGVVIGSSSLISRIGAFVPYWNVNGIAEAVIELMPRYAQAFEQGLESTIAATESMAAQLKQLGFASVYPTEANFVYIKIDDEIEPTKLRDHLLIQHQMFVRSCGNKEAATSHHFRIATRPKTDVTRLINAMKEFIA